MGIMEGKGKCMCPGCPKIFREIQDMTEEEIAASGKGYDTCMNNDHESMTGVKEMPENWATTRFKLKSYVPKHEDAGHSPAQS